MSPRDDFTRRGSGNHQSRGNGSNYRYRQSGGTYRHAGGPSGGPSSGRSPQRRPDRRRKRRLKLIHPERFIAFLAILALIIVAVVTAAGRSSSGKVKQEASSSEPAIQEIKPQTSQATQSSQTAVSVPATNIESFGKQLAAYMAAVLNTNMDNLSTQRLLSSQEESSETARPDLSQYKYIVVIDAAGGGVDKGNYNGDCVEKDITLDVALKMQQYLSAKNPDYFFALTRDRDENRTDAQRLTIAEGYHADLIISLHVNASDLEMGGTTASYWTDIDLNSQDDQGDTSSDDSNQIVPEDNEARQQECAQLADSLMQAAADGIGTWSRGEVSIETDQLLQVKVPAVNVYLGFCTYDFDKELMMDEANRQAAAEKMGDVILAYADAHKRSGEESVSTEPADLTFSDDESSLPESLEESSSAAAGN
jgi:N-acetylmuramoyl-L-alanine amidase